MTAARPTAVAAKCFIDSNVLLYTIDEDERRTPIAKTLTADRFIISVQVLNEFVNVATKKFMLSAAATREALDPIRYMATVDAMTEETHDLAWGIFCTSNFGIYDCNIIAAADLAGCDTLYSEDMSHGQRIGRVTICNPFMVA